MDKLRNTPVSCFTIITILNYCSYTVILLYTKYTIKLINTFFKVGNETDYWSLKTVFLFQNFMLNSISYMLLHK